MRYFGLSSDNLVHARVVLVDGTILDVSEQENHGLLWGMRGAGGNLAIVAELTLRLRPVTTVLSGGLHYDISEVRETALALRDWSRNLSNEMNFEVAYSSAKAAGNESASMIITPIYLGPAAEGQPVIDLLVERTRPRLNTISEKSLLQFLRDTRRSGVRRA